MSRFVNNATRTITLPGGCQCPGTPHDADEVLIHEQLGYGPLLYIGVATTDEERVLRLIATSIVSWNLVDEKGKPVPTNREMIEALDPATASVLSEAINAAISNEPLPNGSGAASADTSPESNSPTPMTRRTRKSTRPSSSSEPAGMVAS